MALSGEPHVTSALALLRMQSCSRYLSTLGNFAAMEAAFGATKTALPRSEFGGSWISLVINHIVDYFS